MKLNLNIQDRHINEGLQGEPTGCAIARALKDKINNIVDVGVFPSHFFVSIKKNKRVQYYTGKLPKIASNFIKKFDRNKEQATPFKMTLTAKSTTKTLATI